MKHTKSEIVRYLWGHNLFKSSNQMISLGDKNVNFASKRSSKYKPYF